MTNQLWLLFFMSHFNLFFVFPATSLFYIHIIGQLRQIFMQFTYCGMRPLRPLQCYSYYVILFIIFWINLFVKIIKN